MLISKTTFLEFQMCPRNTWLKLHNPELLQQFKLSDFELHLLEQGNEVEVEARNRWPHGVLVRKTGDAACWETERLLAAKKTIFQATFVVDGFIAKCDVLVSSDSGTWDIYEIKGTNSRKEGNEDRDHISDLAFQSLVLERGGVKVGRMFIVHLNPEYVRRGKIDVQAMLVKADSTGEVQAKRPEIEEEMTAAKEYLNRNDEPLAGCKCHYRGRSRHCTAFAYSHPEIPEYSVHDIVRIGLSKKKLTYLVDNKIYSLDDVPEDLELGEGQGNQVRAHKRRAPIVHTEVIRAALSGYSYPLHFFDYETFAPAIPAFDGYSPYERIPFQFSLHTLREPAGTLEHVEYLHEAASDPSERVAAHLAKLIVPGGTVLVWHASFERGVNSEIAKRCPQFQPVVERVNGQLRDLEKIFTEQHYVHPKFRGRTSIKAVLPVLCPQLSYEGLAIRDGASASTAWWKMVAGGAWRWERKRIASQLRAYCELDSYAMYAIWKVLADVAAKG
jgi:hypothetical protein